MAVRISTKPGPARAALGSRDLAATAIGVGAAALFINTIRGSDWPLIGSYRVAIVLLWTIGLAMCAVGAGPDVVSKDKGPLLKAATFLAGVASVLMVTGVVTGSSTPFVALGATMLALWILATTRHAMHLR